MQPSGGVSTIENSIVVLPFKNMSSDPDNEYFSDGITEDIINALAKVKELNVIARTSSFAFKGKDIDLREVGLQLKVGNILEGSVRKAGNRVRVTAQLIKASDGFHIFSEVYDREIKDIFEVQDDISDKIVQKFREVINIPKSKEHLVHAPTKNMAAYELYLKGKFYLNKGSLDNINTAIHYFENALTKDKNLVLALTGLSACYTFLGGSGLTPVHEAFSKAKEYATLSNMQDDSIAETHLALARSYFWHEWDFENTGTSIRKAIQLNPGTADIHGFNSVFLMSQGRINEALVEAQLAAKLDPLSLKGKFRLGELSYRTENYIEAINIFDEIIESNPYFQQASILKGWCHIFTGEYEKSIKVFEKIPVTPEKSITYYGAIAFVYSRLGQIDKVIESLQTYKSIADSKAHWLNYNYALFFRALGETERMFEYLEKSLKDKITPLLFLKVDPVWKELREHPEFISLVTRIFESDGKEQITIKADTKENLKIDLSQLVCIEAQENYSRFVWVDSGKVNEKLLRVTLKNVGDQISNKNIVRCHRSFIINIKSPFKILGNSNGYKLKSKHLAEAIPVSRSLGKNIVGKIKEVQ